MSKRNDAIGLFWADLAKVKPPKKEKVKREIPVRFWESPNYLPGLEEARNWKPDLFNDMELWQASLNGEQLLYDTECYPNYWLAMFKSVQTGKIIYFELTDDFSCTDFDKVKFEWILRNFCIVNFNGRKYDFPVTTLALAGYSTEDMWNATVMIIVEELQAQFVYKKYKTKSLDINQIDLIELTALGPGLKVCAGRLHAAKLQDLPFKPGTYLTDDQITIVRRYCVNDLDNTGLLFNAVSKQIAIRQSQGERYGLDLRSHSDAQMAEAIVSSEIKRITGSKFISRSKVVPGMKYKFDTPRFIKYESPLMQWVLATVQGATFHVDPENGKVIMPPELADLVIAMGNCKYSFGIGGLHSQEKSIAHVTQHKENSYLFRKLETKEKIDCGDHTLPDDDTLEFAQRYINHLKSKVT